MRIDVHQHLWSEPLVAALSRRRRAPRVRRDGRLWLLELPGEPAGRIDVDGDDPERRAGLLALDGVDRGLISLSAALGIEALPAEEAHPLLEGYAAGVAALPRQFGSWAALPLREARPRDVDRALDGGAEGVCLPAGALATPAGLDRCGPLLERLELRSAPLFVHPGPDPWVAAAPSAELLPPWWPALTGSVSALQSAWHAFIAYGRPAHPNLRILFAMLAGGAPLHLERLAASGGPADRAIDRAIFYETSSYGARMIDATVRVVGLDQLVYGSDRPTIAPYAPPGPLGEAAWQAMACANPARLFKPTAAALAA
jgi:predicted TIM-barrel fold metal-dependent hydrolase